MSFFSSILSKLGIGSAEAAPDVSSAPSAAPTASHANSSTSAMGAAFDRPAAVTTPAAPVEEVDVEALLTALAEKHPEKLNWKISIVDLLKLLSLDSSLAARKSLAEELGCPAEKMGDSAQMNIWLHKTVLNKIAENGGKVPADLLN